MASGDNIWVEAAERLSPVSSMANLREESSTPAGSASAGAGNVKVIVRVRPLDKRGEWAEYHIGLTLR